MSALERYRELREQQWAWEKREIERRVEQARQDYLIAAACAVVRMYAAMNGALFVAAIAAAFREAEALAPGGKP